MTIAPKILAVLLALQAAPSHAQQATPAPDATADSGCAGNEECLSSYRGYLELFTKRDKKLGEYSLFLQRFSERSVKNGQRVTRSLQAGAAAGAVEKPIDMKAWHDSYNGHWAAILKSFQDEHYSDLRGWQLADQLYNELKDGAYASAGDFRKALRRPVQGMFGAHPFYRDLEMPAQDFIFVYLGEGPEKALIKKLQAMQELDAGQRPELEMRVDPGTRQLYMDARSRAERKQALENSRRAGSIKKLEALVKEARKELEASSGSSGSWNAAALDRVSGPAFLSVRDGMVATAPPAPRRPGPPAPADKKTLRATEKARKSLVAADKALAELASGEKKTDTRSLRKRQKELDKYARQFQGNTELRDKLIAASAQIQGVLAQRASQPSRPAPPDPVAAQADRWDIEQLKSLPKAEPRQKQAVIGRLQDAMGIPQELKGKMRLVLYDNLVRPDSIQVNVGLPNGDVLIGWIPLDKERKAEDRVVLGPGKMSVARAAMPDFWSTFHAFLERNKDARLSYLGVTSSEAGGTETLVALLDYQGVPRLYIAEGAAQIRGKQAEKLSAAGLKLLPGLSREKDKLTVEYLGNDGTPLVEITAGGLGHSPPVQSYRGKTLTWIR